MKRSYNDVVKDLHELADWIENRNGVKCHSIPRRAAYLIHALEGENMMLRMQLNKKDLYFSDYINRVIGLIRFYIYKIKKRL